MRAPLIVIEGLDRTGKTTQTERLLHTLEKQNLAAELIRFPERSTPIGQLIDKYLTDKTFQLTDESIHLLFSANRWELKGKILDLIKNKSTIVVLDRYVYSGVAYSSAKGLDFQWCLNPDKGMPKPDATIFLKFKDSKSTTSRKGFGNERYEISEFQDKVRNEFEKFGKDSNWHNIYVDDKSIEEVGDEIWSIVKNYIHGVDKSLNSF